MKFISIIVSKIKGLLTKKDGATRFGASAHTEELAARLKAVEQLSLVLLKEMLKKDGVQLMFPQKASSSSNFNLKAFQTPKEDLTNKGLNDPKPTLH